MSDIPFQAGGPLPSDSHVYLLREADEKAVTCLRKMEYISLIEPRQHGKTSLINRLIGQFTPYGYTFAIRDLMAARSNATSSVEWYRSLGKWLLRQMQFIPENQRPELPTNSASWEEFLAEIAEKAALIGQRVVIVLDEIGAMPSAWATDFFSIIRSIYTSRQNFLPWQHITFIIAGAFNPKELIQDVTISNFNVDQRISLIDFSLSQVRQLVMHLDLSEVVTEAVSARVHYWTDGQPYLTQRLCLLLAEQKELAQSSIAKRLVDDAVRHFLNEDTHYLERIRDLSVEPELLAYTHNIISRHQTRLSAGINDKHFRLAHIIGVIKADPDGFCQIRNLICEQALASIEKLPTARLSIPEHPIDEFHYDAFISYNRKDSDWVNSILLPYLRSKNLRICIDKHDFKVGIPSLINMENAVDRSRKTLLVLTPNWLKSEWTEFESLLLQTKDPINRGQRILPIMVQSCELPNRLKIFTYLDLTQPTEFDHQMQRLASAIYSLPDEQQSAHKQLQLANIAIQGFAYERGLTRLGGFLSQSEVETRLNFAVLEWRLLNNAQDEQRYGSNEAIRNERDRIMEELNRLAITHLGHSFNDLCKS